MGFTAQLFVCALAHCEILDFIDRKMLEHILTTLQVSEIFILFY